MVEFKPKKMTRRFSGAERHHTDCFGAESHRQGTEDVPREQAMKNEHDLRKMKFRRNPYAKRLKKQMTIRMGVDVLGYFKALAAETGIPYQNLIKG